MAQDAHDTLAAIDLGSNSFHMVIARLVDGQLQTVDRLKEMVRLGGGLQPDGTLSAESQARALAALERFGDRVRHMPQGSVRAVGTNTLRKARGSRGFLERAHRALGHRIDIVSGVEEGRLIYLGVAHGVSTTSDVRRMVIDIGGGSTEVIIGAGFEVSAVQSLYMGCVSFSNRYFVDGVLSAQNFEDATLAARQELRAIERSFPEIGWQSCLGASGTIKACGRAVRALRPDALTVDLEGLRAVRDHMISAGTLDRVSGLDVDAERLPVFAGGLAILIGAFESLGLDELEVSDSAMREGILYDLLGRVQHRDARDLTIQNMARRYSVDADHAGRVERTALELLEQVAPEWELTHKDHASRLRWVCRIHEIGLSIAHSRHHKHGSYLVENSELPGFARGDQQLLWSLVRTQRRAFKPHRFESLPNPTAAHRICVLLRLAVVLNRSRAENSTPEELRLEVQQNDVRLIFPSGWLEDSPLLLEDLKQERDYLAGGDVSLSW